MLLNLLLFAAGLALLYYGAEFLVKGAANTAAMLGVEPIVVGLTVVAFGTSMPELVACLIAVYKGSTGLALGNVVGSNIANIGLVMGVGAVLYPMLIKDITYKRDMPIMLAFTFLTVALCMDGEASRVDGAILFIAVIATTGYHLWDALYGGSDESVVEGELEEILETDHTLSYELTRTAVGLVGVLGGAYLLVESATTLARLFGVSEMVIGVSIVAVGTSLPELATTAVAAMKRQADIAVGAIIGSNIYNLGLIFGVTAFAKPIPVPRDILTGEMAVMALFSVALLPPAYRRRVGKTYGAFFLVAYFAFIWWTAVYKA